MRSLLGGILTLGLATACAPGADQQDELFAAWQAAQRHVRSLVVDFTLTKNDPAFKERHKSAGTFRLLRTPEGDLLASYEIIEEQAPHATQPRWTGLLHKRSLYLLNHDDRTACGSSPRMATCGRSCRVTSTPSCCCWTGSARRRSGRSRSPAGTIGTPTYLSGPSEPAGSATRSSADGSCS